MINYVVNLKKQRYSGSYSYHDSKKIGSNRKIRESLSTVAIVTTCILVTLVVIAFGNLTLPVGAATAISSSGGTYSKSSGGGDMTSSTDFHWISGTQDVPVR
jgi:hypothetical protein